MSIQSEITRISGNVSDALSAIADKGVTVPSGSNSDDLADLISQITGGGGSGGIIYQDLDGYLHLSEDSANVISIVDELDTAGGTIRTITGATESGGGGLPAVLDKVDAGTATLVTSSDVIQVSHNLGRVPDFACIYQDLSDWADVAFGVCVFATYIRFRYSNANEAYNCYIYTWRYKHGTSGNSLGGSSSMFSTNATSTTFKFSRGNVDWATVDTNGNPVTYKWMVGTFKEG